jgi:hypothetical protein
MVIERLLLEQEIQRRIEFVVEAVGVMDMATFKAQLALEVLDVITNPPSIPPGVHIHHIDRNRQHNCPENLMLLDAPIHNYITQTDKRLRREHEHTSMMAQLRAAGSGGA